MGRNIFRDSGFKNVDFSVFKNFTFKGRFNAQFRVEFFNLPNHPLIFNPYGASTNYGGSGTRMTWGPPRFSAAGAPHPTSRPAIRSSVRDPAATFNSG